MEIKGVGQIKEELAKHYLYEDWVDMLRNSGDWSHDKYVDMVAEEYASQFQKENEVLRKEVTELKETTLMYKECFEEFIPTDKWDEATVFLSTYGSGLAKDLHRKGI